MCFSEDDVYTPGMCSFHMRFACDRSICGFLRMYMDSDSLQRQKTYESVVNLMSFCSEINYVWLATIKKV